MKNAPTKKHAGLRDNENRAHAFPLSLANEGERVRISGVKAGKGLTHRLMDLGLPLGSEVKIHQRGPSGAVIVARDNMRIALGVGTTHKVVVVLADAEESLNEEKSDFDQEIVA